MKIHTKILIICGFLGLMNMQTFPAAPKPQKTEKSPRGKRKSSNIGSAAQPAAAASSDYNANRLPQRPTMSELYLQRIEEEDEEEENEQPRKKQSFAAPSDISNARIPMAESSYAHQAHNRAASAPPEAAAASSSASSDELLHNLNTMLIALDEGIYSLPSKRCTSSLSTLNALENNFISIIKGWGFYLDEISKKPLTDEQEIVFLILKKRFEYFKRESKSMFEQRKLELSAKEAQEQPTPNLETAATYHPAAASSASSSMPPVTPDTPVSALINQLQKKLALMQKLPDTAYIQNLDHLNIQKNYYANVIKSFEKSIETLSTKSLNDEQKEIFRAMKNTFEEFKSAVQCLFQKKSIQLLAQQAQMSPFDNPAAAASSSAAAASSAQSAKAKDDNE